MKLSKANLEKKFGSVPLLLNKRAAEVFTLSFTTPTALIMLVSGKSIASTGTCATVVKLRVTSHPILLEPRISGHGHATPGNTSLIAQLVVAAHLRRKHLSLS